jgi:hypothetical protein
MAKSATKGSGAGSRKAADKTTRKTASPKAAPRKAVSAQPKERRSNGGGREEDTNGAADMFVKLLQSPIVADLLAVGATAALAALAEHGFNRTGSQGGKRAGKAVKEAGKAAAAAIGRRLANEVEEIRKASRPKDAEA